MKTETNATTHIRVGFGSQKGGIGKSTIAEVLASYLYYEKNTVSYTHLTLPTIRLV